MKTGHLIVAAGGLVGAAGVALSALAAHSGGQNLPIAANFLLIHAPAFLAVGLGATGRSMRLAATVLLVGLLLFSGDLLIRELGAARLFPMAAPLGGMMMIAGWLGIAASAATSALRARP